MRSAAQLLAPFHLPNGQRVVVAVSGGVDSTVLMHLLSTLPKGQLNVTVATFDHQLRPTSKEEQAQVVQAAAALQLPVITGSWPRQAHPQHGLEAAARKARYAFLQAAAEQAHASVLMTAHHADDQLETLLFRLARSGRVASMTGIAADQKWGSLRLIRPLLGVPKADLMAYASHAHLTYSEDESNQDVQYARNRLRRDAVPALKAVNAGALAHAGTFAQALEATLTLANRQVALMLPKPLTLPLDWRPYLSESAAVQQLLLNAALARLHLVVKPAVAAQVLAALATGQGAKQFALGSGRTLVAAYGQLSVVTPAPAPAPVLLTELNRWVPVGPRQFGRFTTLPAGATFLAAAPAPVVIRTRQPHDEVQLANGQHQLLRRFFINQKIPQPERGRRLVAAAADQVIWVEGIAPRQLFAGSQTDILQTVLAMKSDTKDEAAHE